MTLISDHIIRRQKVKLRYRGRADVRRLQSSLQDIFADTLPEELTKTLDAITPGGETVRIDKLHVQIRLSRADLESGGLARLMSAEIGNAVQAAHQNRLSSAGSDETGRRGFTEALLHYLEHGYLPWWIPDTAAWESAMDERLSEECPGIFIAVLPYLSNKDAAMRLAKIISIGQLHQLLTAAGWRDALTIPIIADMATIGGILSTQARHLFEFNSKLSLIGLTASAPSDAEIAVVMLHSIHNTPTVPDTIYPLHRPSAGAGKAENRLYIESLQFLPLQNALQSADHPAAIRPAEKIAFADKPAGTISEEVSMTTPNAGLALLAAYLPRFFETLEVTDSLGRITDPGRAVALLQLLTGKISPLHEFGATLEKVLCGVDISTALLSHAVTDAEKAEADELLKAVIAFWPALRNTSPEGLQDGFIRREGQLSLNNQNWQLRVTRLAQDLLLDTVPWNFKLIRTPWMKTLLTVEWN